MKKLVRESIVINEKFTDDFDDPINDMGIGGYGFKTLRVGAIITTTVPGMAVDRNNKGNFTNPRTGLVLPVDWPIIVTGVRDYILKGHKEIRINKPGDQSEATITQALTRLKAEGKCAGWGVDSRMIINEKKFDAKFKVVKSGF